MLYVVRRGVWILYVTLLATALFVTAQVPPAPTTPEVAVVWETTKILFAEREAHWHPVCMATPFETDDSGTFLVTAEHCVVGSNAFGIGPDIDGGPTTRVTVVVANATKDLAVLYTPERMATLPLVDDPVIGERVMAVIGPLMWLKSLSIGTVASRPLVVTDGNAVVWERVILILMHGAPGASGGAVYSTTQRGIVAILVGVRPDLDFYAISVPVSVLRELDWKSTEV